MNFFPFISLFLFLYFSFPLIFCPPVQHLISSPSDYIQDHAATLWSEFTHYLVSLLSGRWRAMHASSDDPCWHAGYLWQESLEWPHGRTGYGSAFSVPLRTRIWPEVRHGPKLYTNTTLKPWIILNHYFVNHFLIQWEIRDVSMYIESTPELLAPFVKTNNKHSELNSPSLNICGRCIVLFEYDIFSIHKLVSLSSVSAEHWLKKYCHATVLIFDDISSRKKHNTEPLPVISSKEHYTTLQARLVTPNHNT